MSVVVVAVVSVDVVVGDGVIVNDTFVVSVFDSAVVVYVVVAGAVAVVIVR